MADELVRERALARRLGALQEARRLDCAVVGTEHLLVAAFADPLVREAFGTAGCDLHDVQAAVGSISTTRERAGGDERVELTAEATAVLARVADRNPEVESAAGATSTALRGLVVALLTGSEDTAARRVVAEPRADDEAAAGLVARLTPPVPPPHR